MERIRNVARSWFFSTVPPDAGLKAVTPEHHMMDTTEDVVAETPEHYLMQTKNCLERLSSLSDRAPKFNQEQCKYLAGKLDIALQSACSIIEQFNTWYFSPATPEDKIGCLEIFKFLLSVGLRAEVFIQVCYEDEWIQNALMLTNVSEHIASLGFELEWCKIILTNRKSGTPTSLSPIEVTEIRQTEAEIVREKSDLDERKLRVALVDVTRQRLSSTTDWQSAELLLRKLNSARLQPGVGSLFSNVNLNQMEKVGNGSFGIVYRATWLGIEVATKTFEGPSHPDFLQEVSILTVLSHPNIVSLLGYTTDRNRSHLILELMDGDLYTLMRRRPAEHGDHGSPFSISESFDLQLQTAEGMLYLHEKGIVHRDLKSSNILVKFVKATEFDFKHVQVKVADFGLSRIKERSMTYTPQTRNQGTTRWMAPEMMALRNDDGEVVEAGPEYPFKSDVYSFGMVCFEIVTGDLPFSTLSQIEIKNAVLRGERPQLPALCPSRLRTLIEACWSADPSERPHFRDICAELRHLKCGHLVTSMGAKVPRSFSLEEIRKMTNEFSEGNRFGVDQVYKGKMVGTGKLVLVERVQHNCDLLSPDVWLKVLPGLHHENLMGYVGFCYENGKRILMFEYMPNYTLAGWLLGDEGAFHDWAVRRKICLGVANGIHYLHTGALAKTIRRSINVRTIFLDANFEPKIAAYWRECSRPELGSEKKDVYNYGVVLLQIVSRRLGRISDLAQLSRVIDSALRLQPTEKIEAMRFITIALLCKHSVAATRPDMARVVAMLQGNLDEEIESLRLEHERVISQLPWSIDSEIFVLWQRPKVESHYIPGLSLESTFPRMYDSMREGTFRDPLYTGACGMGEPSRGASFYADCASRDPLYTGACGMGEPSRGVSFHADCASGGAMGGGPWR